MAKRSSSSPTASTRREFLTTTARAAAGAALAPAIVARAHGSVLGANERLGVGFIGLGIRGDILHRATRDMGGTDVVEVCDLYDGHLAQARQLAGERLPAGRDYRRVLDNTEVQAVVISVPDHWHATMALEAMAAGKDVFLEKPMTHRWEEGPKLIEAARTHGRILQVGSQWENMPANEQAIDMIRSGKLGRITLIDGRTHRNTTTGAWYYPVPPDASPETIDWARFLGPAPERPFDAHRFFQWRLYWDYSGGLPTDLFVHMITATHTLMNVRMADRVMAMGGIYHWKGREVPDQMSAMVEYPGFTLTLGATANNSHPYPLLTIMGTEGTLEYFGNRLVYHAEPMLENYTYSTTSWPVETRERFAQLNDLDPASMRPRPTAGMKRPEPQQIQVPEDDATARHLAMFFDSVRTRRQPVQDAEMGHLCAAVGHMVNISYKERREVRWDGNGVQMS